MKKLSMFLGMIVLTFSFVSAVKINAQNRKSVRAAEVNGTFRSYFNGKSKGSFDEIKIWSAGKGKLKVAFDLVYPHQDAMGKMTANMGTADGEATINGDTAVYSSSENGQCSITLKFLKPGIIKVTQKGSDVECGFGANVSADGTYKKVSSAKPKFSGR